MCFYVQECTYLLILDQLIQVYICTYICVCVCIMYYVINYVLNCRQSQVTWSVKNNARYLKAERKKIEKKKCKVLFLKESRKFAKKV
jgi:hypothetical protein